MLRLSLAAMLVAVAGLLLSGQAASAQSGSVAPAPCADGPCCEDGCKRCVCVPDVKKVSHPIYDCKREEYCAPRCCLRALFHHGCQDCCCKVRTKTFLLKKVVTTECPTSKCVVEQGCCSGAGGAAAILFSPGMPPGVLPPPAGQPIPLPRQ